MTIGLPTAILVLGAVLLGLGPRHGYLLARTLLAGALLLLAGAVVLYAGLLGPWGYAAALALLSAVLAPPVRRRLTVLGSAHFAEPEEIPDLLDAPRGVPVGLLATGRPSLAAALCLAVNPFAGPEAACRAIVNALSPRPRQPVVRLPGPHCLVVGPPGSGKSQGVVIQHILALAASGSEDSLFCLDIKAELIRACHAALEAAGYAVYVVDPHKLYTDTPHTFDPVRLLTPGDPQVIGQAKQIAADAVPTEPHEQQPHWPDTARDNLTMSIVYVTEFGGDRRGMQTAIGTVMNRAYRDRAIEVMRAAGDRQAGLLPGIADKVSHAQGDELASVMSTLGTRLSAFSDPAVAAGMASSMFDPKVLKRQKSAVFFVAPPTALKVEKGLWRCYLGATIRAILDDGLGGRTVWGVVDEAATLAQMDAVDLAVSAGRGFGVNMILCYQSLAQMEVCYPHNQHLAVLAQCGQVYTGIADVATGRHVSDTLGPATVVVDSGGESDGTSTTSPHITTTQNSGSTTTSSTVNRNWALQSRPLAHPNEILTLPRGVAISVTPGRPPILSTLVYAFDDPALCAPPPDVAAVALALGVLLLALMLWVL
jgi:type IV secretion system protein VirD4